MRNWLQDWVPLDLGEDRTEQAWAAGFFDGEGCFSLGKNHKRLRITAQISQVDRYVLDRFQRAVGAGKVVGPYQDGRPQARYYWRCQTLKDVDTTANALWEFLSPIKKEQYTRVANVFLAQPPARRGRPKKEALR